MQQPIQLRTGPLSAIFHDGDLRYLVVAGREVVRRIYITVRDASWGTLLPIVRSCTLDRASDGFTIRYDADYRNAEIEVGAHVTITATSTVRSADLSFQVRATARSDFQTNRVGLCVLHPVRELRGRACEIGHCAGSVTHTTFPDLVSPHPPFIDIRSMRYDAGGVSTQIRFDGEAFETEDQRNWADTSYKTYCRPLQLPRPYRLTRGEPVNQAVTIAATIPTAPVASVDSASPRLVIGQSIGRLPELGIVMNDVPGDGVVAQLRQLSLSHIRHDARPGQSGWRDRLRAVASLGWPIDLALHVDDEHGVIGIGPLPSAVRRVIVFKSRAPMTDESLCQAARRSFPGMPIGGGTIANFTELNRNRPAPGLFEFLGYSVTPQVHAMDDLSLMENLASQAEAVRTARDFAPGVPLAIGPVTLHRRADPFAAGNDGRLVEPVTDARHASDFGAAWTVGSIKYLAEAGAECVTCYEATGPHGLLSTDGSAHPLIEVFAHLADFAGGEVLAVSDPQPLRYVGLAVRKNGRTRVLFANTGWEPVSVVVDGYGDVALPLHGIAKLDLETP